MRTRRLKMILVSVLILFFGTLQAQIPLPQSFVREANELQARKTIIRPINVNEMICDVMYIYNPTEKGMFVLSDPYQMLRIASTPSNVQISDIQVVDQYVYWCGRNTISNKGVAGYFDAMNFFASSILYKMIEYPNMPYSDTLSAYYGCSYSTYNISKLEVLSTNSSFPQLAVLCNMVCNGDTTTGIGEIIPGPTNILCYTFFSTGDVERFYDMTLSDNYLLTISTKGPGSDHFPYMVRYFTRQPYVLATFYPATANAFSTHHISTESSGPSLIEALEGDDFIVAYHSRNDNTQLSSKTYLDLFTNVSLPNTSLITTHSAAIIDNSFLLNQNKMYDLAYDEYNKTFWLLHEADASNIQKIITIDSNLSNAIVHSLPDMCIESIDYNNNMNLGTAAGYNITTRTLMEIGKQSATTANCMSTRSATMDNVSPKTIYLYNMFTTMHNTGTSITSETKPVSVTHYHYNCEKD